MPRLAPAAHERGPASGRAQRDRAGAQHGPGGGSGPAGEQLDVLRAQPAALVQVGDEGGGERAGHGETLPDRPRLLHDGNPVEVQDTADLRVLVKSGQQLDVRWPARRRGAADAYRQALVMGGAEHDAVGHAEQLADLVGRQPGPQVQRGEVVRRDGDAVFAVVAAAAAYGHAASAEPGQDGVVGYPSEDRDLGGGHPLLQVEPGHQRVEPVVFGGSARTPPCAAGLDRDTGLVQQPGDALPVGAGDRADLVGGQHLAGIQVGGPFRQRRPRQVSGTFRILRRAVMRAASAWALLIHAAQPPPARLIWQGPLAGSPQLTAGPSAVAP